MNTGRWNMDSGLPGCVVTVGTRKDRQIRSDSRRFA